MAQMTEVIATDAPKRLRFEASVAPTDARNGESRRHQKTFEIRHIAVVTLPANEFCSEKVR